MDCNIVNPGSGHVLRSVTVTVRMDISCAYFSHLEKLSCFITSHCLWKCKMKGGLMSLSSQSVKYITFDMILLHLLYSDMKRTSKVEIIL